MIPLALKGPSPMSAFCIYYRDHLFVASWDGQISQHMFSRDISFKVEPCGTSPYIWNTFIQGTTPFRGYKIFPGKMFR